MELQELLEMTLSGMGYELVDLNRSGKGRMLQVFIDKPDGITVDDCVSVSDHLGRLFTVENIDYDRLEVSSPGLDRSLRKVADFSRFLGEEAKIKLRIALRGRRNFVGILHSVSETMLKLDVDGEILDFELGNLEKARLVPKL